MPDGETPQAEGPQELDDDEVPLAGMEGGNEAAVGIRHMAGAVAIAGAAGIALLAMLILWLKRRKREGAEEHNE